MGQSPVNTAKAAILSNAGGGPTNNAPVVDAGGPVEYLPSSSSATPEQIAAANATSDPIASLNASQGWTASDVPYLQSIGASPEVIEAAKQKITADEITRQIETDAAYQEAADKALAENQAANYGATPEEVAKANAAMAANAGITFKQALDGVRAGLLVNAIAGDPLGLGGGQPQQSAPAGFAQVPIPEDWKSPTYAPSAAPIDLESIFSNQNMLANTQWQNLPNQQPNVSFNDIFAAGQQQTPMGTPVDINQIVSSILGQTATSQKLA